MDNSDIELAELEANDSPESAGDKHPHHHTRSSSFSDPGAQETRPLAPSGEKHVLHSHKRAQHFLHAITSLFPFVDIYVFFFSTDTSYTRLHLLPIFMALSMSLPLISFLHLFVTAGHIDETDLHTTHLTQVTKSMVIFSMVLLVSAITDKLWIIALTSLLVSATIVYIWQRNPADPNRQTKATMALIVLCTLTFVYEGEIQAMMLALFAMLLGILVAVFSSTCLGNWGPSFAYLTATLYIHAVAMAAMDRTISGAPIPESPIAYALPQAMIQTITNATVDPEPVLAHDDALWPDANALVPALP